MWGVLSLVRQGLRLPRRRRQRGARVVDGSALGDGVTGEIGAGDVVVAPSEPAAAAAPAGALARALLSMACVAVRLGGEDAGGAEEAWAASGWRPARAADEVSHLMVREGMRYAIYA